jgi:6-pyruvoyl tetrahydropterin synthase/QueD family protein
MYRILKSIDVDFSHHVRGHLGPCINLHGHTWKLEVALQAAALDAQGFVVDFKQLKRDVLAPCHALLDHALAVGEQTYAEIVEDLTRLGARLVESRQRVHGEHASALASRAGEPTDAGAPATPRDLHGAIQRFPGGMKVAVFPFNPTSERLAEWLYGLARARLQDDRVTVAFARVYETLHPVEAVAEYHP